jgi:hypothetical protein
MMHRVLCPFSGDVLDKAKAAGGAAGRVEAHDHPPDGGGQAKELVHLLFGGVEGQVADVQGAGGGEGALVLLGRSAEAAVDVVGLVGAEALFWVVLFGASSAALAAVSVGGGDECRRRLALRERAAAWRSASLGEPLSVRERARGY